MKKVLYKDQGILVISLEDLKDLLIKEASIRAMGALCFFLRIIDRFNNDPVADIRFYKFKTKNYLVRIFKDTNWNDPLVLFRKRGFMKEWSALDKNKIPEFISKEIFEDSCDAKKRARLVSKMMELKAFW